MSLQNNSESAQPLAQNLVLVVDLDHTLLKTDALHEQVLKLIKLNPLYLFLLAFWLLQGRAALKRVIAEKVRLQSETLPFRQSVLEIIQKYRTNGSRVVLASASHHTVVQEIADHLGIFDYVLGSKDENLKGAAKLAALKSLFPESDFCYVGDSSSDLEIWKHCRQAIAVNPSTSTLQKLRSLGIQHEVITDRPTTLSNRAKVLAKCLRVHQWSKNILLFVPLMAAHQLQNTDSLIANILAFFAFSAIASAVYILNDVLDLESDRAHHTKRMRPFASGKLSLATAPALLGLLLATAVSLCSFLPLEFGGAIAVYCVINILYSFRLKSVFVLDVVLLAALYTARIIAGGLATDTPVSQWLLAFSTFLFFGLAMAKRFTEIRASVNKGKLPGRGYQVEDRDVVLAAGVSSSFLSVLVLALYLNSDAVLKLYSRPDALWAITPVLLYWITRLWLIANRGELDADPVVFTLMDKQSWLTAIVGGLILIAAT